MNAPVAMKCPSCGSALRAPDWDQASGVIRCSYCNVLSTLPKAEPQQPAMPTPAAKPERLEVPMPPGFSCKNAFPGVVITRSWFSHVVWFLIPFAIVWDGFLIFWFSIPFMPGLMKLFALAHVAAGVFITYTVLTTLFNRTVIEAVPGRLRISHGPLPWAGGGEWRASEFKQFYVKEGRSQHRNDNGHTSTSISYQLWAVMRDGSSKKLIGSLTSSDQALFLEQQVERALGIEDKPVAGEMAR